MFLALQQDASRVEEADVYERQSVIFLDEELGTAEDRSLPQGILYLAVLELIRTLGRALRLPFNRIQFALMFLFPVPSGSDSTTVHLSSPR